MNDDRLFPSDAATRAIARRLFREVRDLPIISPHGHTDPRWFAENEAFEDPARLFVTPDHYVFRMLYSQGVPLEDLGVPRLFVAPQPVAGSVIQLRQQVESDVGRLVVLGIGVRDVMNERPERRVARRWPVRQPLRRWTISLEMMMSENRETSAV